MPGNRNPATMFALFTFASGVETFRRNVSTVVQAKKVLSTPRQRITPKEIQKQLALLAESVQQIGDSTAALDEAALHWSPGNREWSAVEILAHLRACADLWTHSIYAMLVEDRPTPPLLDARRWVKVTRYASLDFHASFQAFVLEREELLRVLRQLPEEGWSRTADIGGRTHSVFSQVRRMALHEKEHCEQMELLLELLPV